MSSNTNFDNDLIEIDQALLLRKTEDSAYTFLRLKAKYEVYLKQEFNSKMYFVEDPATVSDYEVKSNLNKLKGIIESCKLPVVNENNMISIQNTTTSNSTSNADVKINLDNIIKDVQSKLINTDIENKMEIIKKIEDANKEKTLDSLKKVLDIISTSINIASAAFPIVMPAIVELSKIIK